MQSKNTKTINQRGNMKKNNFLQLLTTASLASTSFNSIANTHPSQNLNPDNILKSNLNKLITYKEYTYIIPKKVTIKTEFFNTSTNITREEFIEGRIKLTIIVKNMLQENVNSQDFDGMFFMTFESDDKTYDKYIDSDGKLQAHPYTRVLIESGNSSKMRSDSTEELYSIHEKSSTDTYSIHECSSTETYCMHESSSTKTYYHSKAIAYLTLNKITKQLELRIDFSDLNFNFEPTSEIKPYSGHYELNLLSIKDIY